MEVVDRALYEREYKTVDLLELGERKYVTRFCEEKE